MLLLKLYGHLIKTLWSLTWKSLGFSNLCTLDDVKEAYPLLDMVDHENRKVVARGYKENNDFPKIEGKE